MSKRISKSPNIQSICNIASTIIVSGTNFITMPMYSRLFGAEQYGMYSLFNSWLNIALCLFGLRIYSSISTGFYKFKSDYKDFKMNIFRFGNVVCIVMAILMFFAQNRLSEYFSVSTGMIFLLVILSCAHYVIDFSNAAWIYEKNALYNLIVSTTLAVVSNVISLLLIWFNPTRIAKYENRILGTTLTYLVVSVVLVIILVRGDKCRFKKEYCIYGISYGIPVVFHNLSQTVLAQSDRVMMQNMGVSTSDIGVYSFYYTYVSITNIILVALNNSWMPFLYDDLDHKNYRTLESRMSDYAELFTIIMCGFVLLSREVSYIFASEEYRYGLNLIPFIAVSVYFTFLYQFPVNYEFYSGKPKIVATGTALSALMNIALNLILIGKYGMYGAAVATFMSYGFLFIIHILVVYSWNENRYPVNSNFMIKNIILMITACIFFYIFEMSWYIRWGLGVLIGIYLVHKIYLRKTIF